MDNNNKQLIDAVNNNQIDDVKYLLKQKDIDVNVKNKDGNSALHVAASIGNIEIVKLLLENKDINVNIKNNSGCTALHLAALYKHPKIVKLILQNENTNIDIIDQNHSKPNDYIGTGKQDDKNTKEITEIFEDYYDIEKNPNHTAPQTLLFQAALFGHTKKVKELLEGEDVDVNGIDKDFLNVLQKAVESGNIETVKLLLENKIINVNSGTECDTGNALNIAIYNYIQEEGEIEMVKLLLSHENINPHITKADVNNDTKLLHTLIALQIGIHEKRIEIIDLLLQHKNIDVNIGNKQKLTPLHYAVFESDVKIINLLLKRGANINAKDTTGNTPLHIAAEHTNQKVMSLLLTDNNIDVNIKDNGGKTVLHYAVIQNNKKMVELLLENGAVDLNIRDNTNKTPIKYANNPEIIAILNKYNNIDVNTKDKDGVTLLHKAAVRGCIQKVRQLLKQPGVGVNTEDKYGFTPLHSAVIGTNKEIVDLLLKNNAKIDIADRDGKTALHHAAQYAGSNEIVDLLLKNNANAVDKDANTALHLAVSDKNNAATVKSLLESEGIDLNIRNRNEQTPLHIAVSTIDNTEIIELLLKHKDIDVNIKSAFDQTALHLAVIKNNMEAVKLLLKHKKINVNPKDISGLTPIDHANNQAMIDLLKAHNAVPTKNPVIQNFIPPGNNKAQSNENNVKRVASNKVSPPPEAIVMPTNTPATQDNTMPKAKTGPENYWKEGGVLGAMLGVLGNAAIYLMDKRGHFNKFLAETGSKSILANPLASYGAGISSANWKQFGCKIIISTAIIAGLIGVFGSCFNKGNIKSRN